MRQRSARRLRRIAIATVIAMIPLAIMLIAMTDLLRSKPMAVALDYIPVVAINESSTTVGIADSDIWNSATTAEINARLDQMQSLGVNTVRIVIPWGGVEVVPGIYDWSKADAIVKAAVDRNMGVLAVLNSTPFWHAAQPGAEAGTWGAAPDPQKFATFAGKAAAHFGQKIDAYEIWNEPNWAAAWFPGPDPVTYTKMLKLAYTAIKAANDVGGVVNPNDPTVVAGVLGAFTDFFSITSSPVTYLKQMYQNGAAGFFDALSYHPYSFDVKFSEGTNASHPSQTDPLDMLIKMRQLMIQYGDADTKIWATEYGLPTNVSGGVSVENQVKYIQDFLDKWSTLSYTGPAFIYSLRDHIENPMTLDGSYGLFKWDAATSKWVWKTVDVWDPVTQTYKPTSAAEVIQAFIEAHPDGWVPPIKPAAPVAAPNPIAQLMASLQAMFNNFAMSFQNIFGSMQAAFNAAAQAISNLITGIFNPLGVSQKQQAQVAQVTSFAAMSFGAEVSSDPSDSAGARFASDDGTDTETAGSHDPSTGNESVGTAETGSGEAQELNTNPTTSQTEGSAGTETQETEETQGTQETQETQETSTDLTGSGSESVSNHDTDNDGSDETNTSGTSGTSGTTVESGTSGSLGEVTGAESREPERTGFVARPGHIGPDDSNGSGGSTTTTVGTTTAGTTTGSSGTTTGGSTTGGSGSEGSGGSGSGGEGSGGSGSGGSESGGEGSGGAS
jgi:polysaccharide biosynthesis protein PslG